ncbi:hypothetical protein [Paenibacillus lentus]|uniref:DUF4878 domain-containing protein n=1 Tax=Paenibacillus lentus TaxID=1338368 RepID=A0A3Q8S8Q6_9BACL|nr:hypothetical protein [Paenibacillus lentus]AZK45025.1 hypothetical protein EIM92_01465 [Paenibacillus lentus]
MRILKSGAYVIVLASVLLIAGCTDKEKTSGKPIHLESSATNQLLEPANGSAISDASTSTNTNINAETNLPEADKTGMNGSEQEVNSKHRSHTNINGSAGQLYGLAFEAMMSIDEALNEDMTYIAIDFSVLSQLTDEDKRYIEERMGQFAVPVKDATLEQLKESEGNEIKDNDMVLGGVLLQIDKVDISENGAIIAGTKYRSGNGAIGIQIELTLEDGSWMVKKAAST